MPLPELPTPLTRLLSAKIRDHGPISFREFMAAALYHPEYGYYSSGRAAIGRSGDFITNVSVGRLFGTLLARQFIEMWEHMDRPTAFALIEQGAHDGTLMEDVLVALSALCQECAVAVRPTIIEPAPVWREKQRTRLKEWPVSWVESVEALTPFTGIHYSNELLDAFPVHLVRRGEDDWSELYVEWKDGRFAFVDRPIENPQLRARSGEINAPPDYRTEICLDAAGWMGALGERLVRGYILAIDYGFPRAEYYRSERTEGTLEAIAAHRRESDVLAHPGELDLTAHVDFTTLAEAAREVGLRIEGFTDQHHFLVGLAARHFPEGQRPAPSDMRAFQTLAHPTMLGRSFKVFVASQGMASGLKLAGFTHARDELEVG